ncbi:MAG: hypothetical protein KIS67_07420 [Verrucomicrobiae bacterium]|nr:hypothetical protein [Verrucomicrobiae bacterium]
MKTFFRRNIDRRGRVVRGVAGGLLVVGGLIACSYNVWLCVALVVSGGFVSFEAARGWCLMRACGIKTKL